MQSKGLFATPRRVSAFACAAVVLVITIYLLRPRESPVSLHVVNPYSETPILDTAANATLGFQAIFALTVGTRWRVEGLQHAADLTGLRIDTPIQPPVNDEMLASFQQLGLDNPDEHAVVSRGAALSWLGHRHLLKHVVEHNISSALIVEDDVDFDITIRDQVRPLSTAMRSIDSPRSGRIAPYGLEWDVLWLGHCGENFQAAKDEQDRDLKTWPDISAPPHGDYIGIAMSDLSQLPEKHRALMRARSPICTFAYAVTNSGANRLLDIGSPKEGIGSGAFDVKLSTLCGRQQLRCRSVVLELMNQYTPDPGSVPTELQTAEDKNNAVNKATAFDVRGATPNILDSARCWALFNTTCRALP